MRIGTVGVVIQVLLLAAPVLAQKESTEAPKLPPGLYAVIQTSMGTITAELYDTLTPNTVRNFIGLANGTQAWLDPKTRKAVRRPLYDNITFHRVIPDFMAQTGDPTGTGAHNCGYVIKDEIVAGLRFDRPGRLAMANIGQPNTGACQFFITEKPYPMGNGNYTIFGQVVEGLNVVTKMTHVIRDAHDKPQFPIKLIHVAVTRVVAAPAAVPTAGRSGIFVNSGGDILSSASLAKDCTQVQLADGTKVQIAIEDSKNGLVLWHSERKTGPVAVFRGGDDVAANQMVTVAGTAAAVSAAADSRFLQVASAPAAGSRGGPVLDSSGHVAGVLADPVEGATPTASLVIKTSVALGFLDASHIAYQAQPSSAPDQAAAAGAAAYMVSLQCLR